MATVPPVLAAPWPLGRIPRRAAAQPHPAPTQPPAPPHRAVLGRCTASVVCGVLAAPRHGRLTVPAPLRMARRLHRAAGALGPRMVGTLLTSNVVGLQQDGIPHRCTAATGHNPSVPTKKT
uniref:Uncharacterized protein n=1 Tax=Oryza sativa subsp. indica TaxID=39946 RepID=A0A679B8W2_ORYSI|nr:hypothetical protein [Oryza sativa Indica Group]